MNVPLIQCPKCQRTWPAVSEQGECVKRLDRCFACFCGEITEVVVPAQQAADYVIENCPTCGGVSPDICAGSCRGRGWVAVPK